MLKITLFFWLEDKLHLFSLLVCKISKCLCGMKVDNKENVEMELSGFVDNENPAVDQSAPPIKITNNCQKDTHKTFYNCK